MSRYALRAAGAHDRRSGGGRRPSGLGAIGSSNGNGNVAIDAEVAALAALDAGLLPTSLSKEEMRRFATVGPSEYLEARSLVLSRWASDPTVELTSEACVVAAACPDPISPEKAELVREAHRYLSLIGAINFGIVRKSAVASQEKAEEAEKPAAAAAAAAAPAPAAAPPSTAASAPSDGDLLSALAAELAVADMGSTTEKTLRKKLELRFGGVDLTGRKPMLRAAVERFLVGEPVVLGEENAEERGKEKEKDEEEEEQAPPAPRRRPPPPPPPPPPLCRPGASAVVVGAGPAGLGAALHLSRCGVRVTVLEARARAGGRAHSVAARAGGGGGGGGGGARDPGGFPRLASAVDLGASIVTGVAPDFSGAASLSANATSGRRSDPSALLARQLGVSLHRLGESLPLFDSGRKQGGGGGGGGGIQVSKEADERADTMRDALLDDAKDAAFHSSSSAEKQEEGEEKRRTLTLGEFLEGSLAARLAGASARRERKEEGEEEEKPGGGDGGSGDESDEDDAEAKERAAFAAATATELRLLDWHWANLEYGCAAPLSKVCLSNWNQDDTYGGFGGGHAMVVGGFGALLEKAADELAAGAAPLVDLRLSTPVKGVRWGAEQGSGGGGRAAAGAGGGGGGGGGDGSDADGRGGRGGGGGVVVVTAAGEEVSADVAIVTVSLGVLKASIGQASPPSPSSSSCAAAAASIAFDPPLPPWKADAVRALGFGKLEKVFLEFEGERFWPEGLDYFGVLQPTATTATAKDGKNPAAAAAENDGNGTKTSPAPPPPPPPLLLARDPSAAELARGKAFMFWDVGRFQPGSPPVLAALFSGAAAESFLGGGGGGGGSGSGGSGGGGSGSDGSGGSDGAAPSKAAAAAVQAALSSLRSAFGPSSVPDPVATLTTRWGSDPHSGGGAYSFVAPGSSGATYDLLARPCSRRLLFAGEHTAREHPDTVGGAMLSGIREAARALGWGGVLGNAAVDGEEATRRRRRRMKGGGVEVNGEESSSGEDDSSSSSSSSDDDDDDVDDEERNERRREAAEAALMRREKSKKTKPRKQRSEKPRKDKEKRRQPRREAAARASSPDRFGSCHGNGDYARTAEQAELDARTAAAERADARSLWGALALASSGADPRARGAAEALSAADAAPHRRAVVLCCLTTADAASLASLAKNPGIVRMISSWTEEAARASAGASSSSAAPSFSFSSSNVSATAVATDGARVLGSLPLPAAERGPSGAERAVRAVASQCRDASAREAAGAVLDSWFGKARRKEAQPPQQQQAAAKAEVAVVDAATVAGAAFPKKPEASATRTTAAIAISDDALPPELRARLLEAERAAAEAAEHAAAAERIEAQLAAARRAAAAGRTATATAAAAVAVSAPVVADIGDFDAYLAARAKEEAKRRGLKRRKDAAAAALAAAEAEEEEEEARERKKQSDDGGKGGGEEHTADKARETAAAAALAPGAALLQQEITGAVRACVSSALKRRLKQGKEKLSKEQYDGVARKAAAKIVEAEVKKHAEALANAPGNAPPPGFHLSDSKQEKIDKLVGGYVKAAAAAGSSGR